MFYKIQNVVFCIVTFVEIKAHITDGTALVYYENLVFKMYYSSETTTHTNHVKIFLS